MYILYLDESGNPDDPSDRHCVLAGAAVFERVVHFLTRSLDEVQAKHLPGLEPIDFHAAEIRSGRGFWRGVEKEKREAIVQDVTTAIADANHPGVVLFGAVIEKNERLYGEEAVKHATEEVCRRFDILLRKRYQEHGDPQRGLIVFAESSRANALAAAATATPNDFGPRGSRHHRSRLRRRAAEQANPGAAWGRRAAR